MRRARALGSVVTGTQASLDLLPCVIHLAQRPSPKDPWHGEGGEVQNDCLHPQALFTSVHSVDDVCIGVAKAEVGEPARTVLPVCSMNQGGSTKVYWQSLRSASPCPQGKRLTVSLRNILGEGRLAGSVG